MARLKGESAQYDEAHLDHCGLAENCWNNFDYNVHSTYLYYDLHSIKFKI